MMQLEYILQAHGLLGKKQKSAQIYGVKIEKSNFDPEAAVTYIDDAEGFTPVSGNDGSFDYGSW